VIIGRLTISSVNKQKVVNVVPKYYIKNNSQEWADFFDFLENGGRNLLRKFSTCATITETSGRIETEGKLKIKK